MSTGCHLGEWLCGNHKGILSRGVETFCLNIKSAVFKFSAREQSAKLLTLFVVVFSDITYSGISCLNMKLFRHLAARIMKEWLPESPKFINPRGAADSTPAS